MSRTILEVMNLKKYYRQRAGVLSAVRWREQFIPAVDGVSFYLKEHETLGLVGESGCGKTTIGRTILRLTPATSGRIVFDGHDITAMSARELRPLRRQMQMIFQDLDAALNPKMRVRDLLREAITVHHRLSDDEVGRKTGELLEQVNLKKSKLSSFPRELSGGEKRRVGIARTLAVGAHFIVADEPTSALDVSIQALVVNLLRDLQRQLGLSYLFISHDLEVVQLVSHKVAVMYLGKIVEMGLADRIAGAARHPYTQILWSAAATTSPVIFHSGEPGREPSSTLERDLFGVRGPVAIVGARIGRPGGLVEIDCRSGFELEVAERIDTADQHGRRLVLHAQVLHVRRDVADRQADPTSGRPIRLRAVEAQRVVQRELARAQWRVNRRRVVHVPDDRLPRTIHAAGDDARAMGQLPATVTAGQKLHAAVLCRRIGEREPRGDVHVRAQSEIRGVLMPGGDRRAFGLLDEPRRGVHEDIGTDEILDGVQDRRLSSERMHPGQEDVRAGPVARIRPIGRERSADGLFERLEFPAIGSC